MNRIWWRLTICVSRMLDADERDAALGDLTESGATGFEALRDLLGLVARRQAGLWKDWQPWLALLGVACLAGIQILTRAVFLGGSIARQYATYRSYGVFYELGLPPALEMSGLVCQAAALILWCWTGGFVLASMSRRTLWVSSSAVLAIWLHFAALMLRFVPSTFVLQVLACALPALLGARQGLKRSALSTRSAWLLTFAVLTLTALAAWWEIWRGLALIAGGWLPGPARWQAQIIPFVLVSWPVWWIAGTARPRRI